MIDVEEAEKIIFAQIRLFDSEKVGLNHTLGKIRILQGNRGKTVL